jgi:hypothetical protein
VLVAAGLIGLVAMAARGVSRRRAGARGDLVHDDVDELAPGRDD